MDAMTRAQATRRRKALRQSAKPRPGLPRAQRPPADVTRDLFLVWRAPRVGEANPQRLTNPVWSWLARQRDLHAYTANAHFRGPSSLSVGPCWCASRFGQSETALPDGRVIAIGGEHEDSYDPDFYIYNDVIVTDPAGALEIYGYSHAVFPPTDFHSATLDGERIIVIGCAGHPSQRVPAHTPVFALDTRTLAITRLETTGAAPGWLYKHQAARSADGASIVVRGGERLIEVDGEQMFRENPDDWSLDLGRLVWTRLTERPWQQWELARADGKANNLLMIWCGSHDAQSERPFARKQLAELEQDLGFLPDFTRHAQRFAPPLEHATIESDHGAQIVVDGVTVRYREEPYSVRVTIEGPLAPEKVQVLIEDARAKLEELERTPYVARPIGE